LKPEKIFEVKKKIQKAFFFICESDKPKQTMANHANKKVISAHETVINFNHVVFVKDAAEELCYTQDFQGALSHLDSAVCMLQVLKNGLDAYIDQDAKDTIRNAMANVLDDMSCIEHRLKNYEASIYYMQLRMNMLLGYEKNGQKMEVPCNCRALADAHSGMFATLRLHAADQEAHGKLQGALETSLLALKMLEHCHDYVDNHVHICDTMLHVERLLDALGKPNKAKDFEFRSGAVQNSGATATCLYSTDEKIFVRPLHGESPVMRHAQKPDRVAKFKREASSGLLKEVAVFMQYTKQNGLSIQQEAQFYRSMQINNGSCAAAGTRLSTDDVYRLKYKEHKADMMMRQLLLEEEAQLAAPKKASRKQRRAESKKKHEALGAASGNVGGGASSASGACAACGPVEASNESDALSHFHCPLTLEVMKNPVVTVDGHSFEESAIRLWLQDHDTSPMTNQVLASKVLIPNITLKVAIEAAGLLVVDRI
jgi:hypothetical protein